MTRDRPRRNMRPSREPVKERTYGQSSVRIVGHTVIVMERLRSSALPVGLAMGLIFAVVGLTTSNYGLIGLGVVVALAGFLSRKADG